MPSWCGSKKYCSILQRYRILCILHLKTSCFCKNPYESFDSQTKNPYYFKNPYINSCKYGFFFQNPYLYGKIRTCGSTGSTSRHTCRITKNYLREETNNITNFSSHVQTKSPSTLFTDVCEHFMRSSCAKIFTVSSESQNKLPWKLWLILFSRHREKK